jgi:hypothetical protein
MVAALSVALAVQPALGGSASPAADKPGISPTTQFTPVASHVLTVPQPVKASDGNFHLAYELLLTNATGVDVDITSVEVRDASDGRVLLALSGDDLASQINPIGKVTEGDAGSPIPSSSTSIVWLDVIAPAKDAFPKTIDHQVTGSIHTAAGLRPFKDVVSKLAINTADPVVLSSPLPAGTWLASEGCCHNVTHHRHGLAPINGVLQVPQRFAIDFFLLDDKDRTWVGDPKDVHSYLSYEKPVSAAADGEVVAAFDGLPNQHPPAPPPIPPIADTVGNHVILKVAPDVYLLYAHMKPGSVAVRAGDELKVGQHIGLIGTTGNSTTPHLHFQVLTTPTFFPADSTPYVFKQFEVVGHEEKRIWDDNIGLQPTGTIPVGPAPNAGPKKNAMPLDRDIVKF